jgi:hypothetical protein
VTLGCSVAFGCSMTLGCSMALGCSVAHMVVRLLDIRQARVRISARHPMEVLPSELTAMKIPMEMGLSECI